MTRPPRALVVRAIAYFALRDLIPLYELYALLFADHGLSPAAISTLFIVWSVTSFALEVPSGAWADIVSRRALLVLSAALYASGFSLWIVAPSFAGFAAGFVLWGVSGALMSGTFEALLYDELVACEAADRYATVMGWAEAASVIAQLAASAAATPLMAVGGYPLVGWVSVAVAVTHGGLALLLPNAPAAASAVEDLAGAPAAPVLRRYIETLRVGIAEAMDNVSVRRSVVISALLLGLTVYDEYFSLIARDGGISTVQVPLLMTLVIAGQAAGSALAGRSSGLSSRALAWLLGAAAVGLATGAVLGGAAGLVVIGLSYGAVGNVTIVTGARLQESVAGPARATVTSTTGFLAEVEAVVLYAVIAGGSAILSLRLVLAGLAVPLLGVALLARRWLPEPLQQDAASGGGQ